jgi:AraC-like DNA-binding protein
VTGAAILPLMVLDVVISIATRLPGGSAVEAPAPLQLVAQLVGKCYSSRSDGFMLGGKSSVRLNPHKQVRLARLLLDRSCDAPITIEDLSREVALSPYYLIRAFRHVYKQTPHQYLVGQRIARAKELLRNSDLSITEICAAVGFESLGSFSTLFRKVAGLSPRAYRISSQPTPNPTYIPLCACWLHGIKDQPDL